MLLPKNGLHSHYFALVAIWLTVATAQAEPASKQPDTTAQSDKTVEQVAAEKPNSPAPDLTQPIWPTTPAEAWPIFRGNSLGTGVSGDLLPPQLELLWKMSVPKGAFECTPALVNGILYAADLDGTVYALKVVDGSEVWRRDFGEDGFSGAVAVRDGLVYVGNQAGLLLALDAATAKTVWEYQARGQLYGANFAGDRVLCGSQDGVLHCLNAKTGEKLWTFQIPDQIRCSATISQGHAFLVGCDGQLHVIDIQEGKSVRDIPINAPAGSTAAAAGDLIYFGTSAGEFLCINWRTGDTIWNFQDKARQQQISGSAALTDKTVFVPGEDKTLRAFRANDGKDLWKYTFRGKLDASPVVAGERVFIGAHDGRIVGVNIASGKKEWEYEAGGRFSSSPIVAGGRLFICSEDGVIYCFGKK
ncbi:MAG: PQQ-binding-like beta-propeller repeat protein [Pirellulales bacterium]|nr:PQQ-binding-like beta-propeller repeat protein [Pirellulales bacterium]